MGTPRSVEQRRAGRRVGGTAALLAACAFLSIPGAMAQGIRPNATLDTANILIGQQAHLRLSVDYRVDQGGSPTITWPAILDTLTSELPVLHDSHVDTLLPDRSTDPYLFRQERTLTITSWDSGYWAIPPFHFLVNGDTVSTDPLLLTVNTVAVDTTQAFRPIKGIYTVRFNLLDWLRENWTWITAGWFVLLLILGFIVFYKRRRSVLKEAAPAPPPVPAHVLALRALEELRAKKLCEQGLVKEHCAGLADILRAYIETRYDVPALERTTDELIAALRPTSLDQEKRSELEHLLQLADLAKFAKWRPSLPETDKMLANAFLFVQHTTDERTHAPQP